MIKKYSFFKINYFKYDFFRYLINEYYIISIYKYKFIYEAEKFFCLVFTKPFFSIILLFK